MTQKEDAQLAEMNFALQAPITRREFAGKLFFCMNLHGKSHTDNSFVNRKEREYENFILQYQTL